MFYMIQLRKWIHTLCDFDNIYESYINIWESEVGTGKSMEKAEVIQFYQWKEVTNEIWLLKNTFYVTNISLESLLCI